MKKILIVLLLLLPFHVNATTPDLRALNKFLNTASVENNEEAMLAVLFSLPLEYHQYLMPAVANMRFVSEKTRMMPGIVEWRGKLPTRIAPELTDYAQKYLAYLNPLFYPFLMPEAWESYHTHQKEGFSPVVETSFDIQDKSKIAYLFPDTVISGSVLDKIFNPPVVQKENSSQSNLTDRDVKTMFFVLEKFKNLEDGLGGLHRQSQMFKLFKRREDILDAIVSPCQSLVERYSQIDTEGFLDTLLAKENMTKNDFANKCDRIIKAYRVLQLEPSSSDQIKVFVKKAFEYPQGSYMHKFYLLALHMFQADLQDVHFVKQYEDEIRQFFYGKSRILTTPIRLGW